MVYRGQITGNDTVLAPQEIYKLGVRLYTIEEIFDWIHIEELGMRLTKNINLGYKFVIIDENGIEYKGSGGDLHASVFNILEKYLLKNQIKR